MTTHSNAIRHRLLPIVGGLALVALVLLLPDISGTTRPDSGDVVEAFRGRIESIQLPTATDDSGNPPVPMAKVKALDGPRAGQVLDAYLSGPGGSQSVAGYAAGDEVVVTIAKSPDGQEPFISVSDRWRLPAVFALLIFFAAAVIVVGGWQGARALIALGLTVVVILKILLPLVIRGVPPVPLAVVTASAVTVLTILLTEGSKRSSFAAILGTTAALALTGLLAAGATAVMGFTYAASDLGYLATQGGQGLDLRGVLLASFILGAVGVLDDVTVTQAALVEEIGDKGGLHGRSLFSSGMGIGRSHIAATVNTLFLAYVGASLPLLVVLIVSAQPTALLFNDEVITTEIVRAVVGSLGIIAAVPLTTFVATTLVTGEQASSRGDTRSAASARAVPITLAIVVTLLLLTAALPLTGGASPVLAPDVFDPDASFPAVQPSEEVLPSDEPIPSAGSGPTVVTRGQAVPITLDGQPVGLITVKDWERAPAQSAAATDRLTVHISYQAEATFPLDAGSWALVLDDGTDTPFELAGGGSGQSAPLAAGESETLTFEAEIPTSSLEPVLVYLDVNSGDAVFAITLDS